MAEFKLEPKSRFAQCRLLPAFHLRVVLQELRFLFSSWNGCSVEDKCRSTLASFVAGLATSRHLRLRLVLTA
jgi:hypothetical protein